MSLKQTNTTSDYIEWDKLIRLTEKLEDDNQLKFSLLISLGMFTGLRIGDMLNLKWIDILNQDHIELVEKKTSKYRKIMLHEILQKRINRIYNKLIDSPLKSTKVISTEEYVFSNKYKTGPISVQFVNHKLKELMNKHRIRVNRVSSHSLRKSFGRRVWEMNNYSDRSLILLSEILNHSSVSISKRYLGIQDDEIIDIYRSLEAL